MMMNDDDVREQAAQKRVGRTYRTKTRLPADRQMARRSRPQTRESRERRQQSEDYSIVASETATATANTKTISIDPVSGLGATREQRLDLIVETSRKKTLPA